MMMVSFVIMVLLVLQQSLSVTNSLKEYYGSSSNSSNNNDSITTSSTTTRGSPSSNNNPTTTTTTTTTSCRHVRNARHVSFDPHKAGDTLYILLSQPDTCNIFHTLWSYVAVFRDAMIFGVLPYAQARYNHHQQHNNNNVWRHHQNWNGTLHVVVVLPTCHAWLEMMVRAFPTHNLPVVIRTKRTDQWDDYLQLGAYPDMSLHNCITLKYKWASFLGGQSYFEENVPRSATEQMHQWADYMRSYYYHHHNNPRNITVDINDHGHLPNGINNDMLKESNDDTSDQMSINVDVCQRQRPLALFVERSCTDAPRTAIDLATGAPAFPLLLPLTQKLGYDAELLSVCNDTLQQFTSFSRANVVVSVHGAQLSNIIFMKPCHQYRNNNNKMGFHPALVEISFRFAWCDPKPPHTANGSHAALLDQWRKCRRVHHGNTHYHKADFFRLATGMGIRYTEVIHDSLVGRVPDNSNPITVQGVVVNSSLILQELHRLLQDNAYDYKQHPSYNGMEGVAPYRIGRVSLMERLRERLKEWYRQLFTAYL